MKYIVLVEQTDTRYVEVDAKNKTEAIDLAKEEYQHGHVCWCDIETMYKVVEGADHERKTNYL